MKILKHGIVQKDALAKPRRFCCIACKCEFEAEPGEYSIQEVPTLFGAFTLEAVGICPECQSNAREIAIR